MTNAHSPIATDAVISFIDSLPTDGKPAERLFAESILADMCIPLVLFLAFGASLGPFLRTVQNILLSQLGLHLLRSRLSDTWVIILDN